VSSSTADAWGLLVTNDFGTNDAWGTWSADGSFTWSGANPTFTSVCRYKVANGTCFFTIEVDISDGNDSAGLVTAPLPISPKGTDSKISINMQVIEVASALSFGNTGAYINATTPSAAAGIVANVGAVGYMWPYDDPTTVALFTNAAAWTVIISGQYEI
jgi:hypothetical protein